MDVSDAKRLQALETEIARLKKLLSESMRESEVTVEARPGQAGKPVNYKRVERLYRLERSHSRRRRRK